jgi:type III restriction enzyme
METEIRKKAIENLNPLCTLRYSATHKNYYNMIYSLNPVQAYDLGLVKQIEVDSVVAENDQNRAFISIVKIKAAKSKVTADIMMDINEKSGVKRANKPVKVGDDLYRLSNERSVYKDGFIIEEIDAVNQSVTFSNGVQLTTGQSQGGLNDQLMKFQIQKTIEEHLKKEKRLNPKGIKVLSLFFIDRVANYRDYDDAGNIIPGKFAIWFEECYRKLLQKPQYSDLARSEIKDIHNGYFSNDNKGRLKDTNGQTQADDDTYSLIMKDKERLLDLATPLRFIFSHSALREGWDNPNVFQICTLNETKSEMKKRQEIGRGLRLSVNQQGERVFDKNINRLTVIANEAYHDFASSLQKEIEDDCGISFEGRIKDAQKREYIEYRKGFEVDPRFLEIWKKIEHKTVYRVAYDSEKLIENAAAEVFKMETVSAPSIRSTKVGIRFSNSGIEIDTLSDKMESYKDRILIPDILAYIQSKTELTRKTILEIIIRSNRSKEILVNPQLFMDQTIDVINNVLQVMMVEGIQYTKLNGTKYEMKLFEDYEIEAYLDSLLFSVKNNQKTIYDKFIPLDSEIENQFAKDCETSENVEFYFKLPFWFKIPTPIGTYNPDWAVVFHNEKKIYFVTETKSTKDLTKLRRDEQLKIKCGHKHYEVFEDVEYRHVTSLRELGD